MTISYLLLAIDESVADCQSWTAHDRAKGTRIDLDSRHTHTIAGGQWTLDHPIHTGAGVQPETVLAAGHALL